MRILKPMLAAKLEDTSKLRFPLLMTPKIDGIRCLKVDGKVLTRSFKPVRNRHIAEQLAALPDGVDGELVLRDADFSDSQSGIMSADGAPDFLYCCFDLASSDPYRVRVSSLPTVSDAAWYQPIVPALAQNLGDFLWYEEKQVEAGYEGVVARSLDSPYKFGRSSLREGFMLKYKRFSDSEAVIIGFVEAMENLNEATRDAIGRLQRLGGNMGFFPKGTLGGFLVRDGDVEFSIGTGKGLTAALRQHIWDNQPSYLGRVVNYRFQSVGAKDRPRFPSFQSFKEQE